VERNLRGLTMGVPTMQMQEVPYHLQRHTVGCLRELAISYDEWPERLSVTMSTMCHRMMIRVLCIVLFL
jgi:hypothetical protein